MHVFPPTFKEATFAVARPTIVSSESLLTVSENSVEHRMDQTFFNDNEYPLQGLFLLPLAPGRAPKDLDVRINGLPTPFKIIHADGFFDTLRKLTEEMKDPSLMGLAGRDVLVVRPVNIGIRAQVSVSVQFKTPLVSENDRVELFLSLAGERYSLGPVEQFEIRVRFKMSRPVRSVFSPTHHIEVFREAPHRCLVTVRSEKKRVRNDFLLLITLSGSDLDLRVLNHRSPGEKGTFMVLIAPPVLPPKGRVQERDVVFLLDSSGSMDTAKLELAKRAVIAGLERLRPRDKFNVLSMQTGLRRLSDGLLPANNDNITAAVAFVNSTSSQGGTDFYNGLMNALEQFSSRKRSHLVIVVGDGRGTVGVTEPGAILEGVKRRNRLRARIFTLTLGPLADVAMMDSLAVANRGVSFHFAQKEDFQPIVQQLLAGVDPPRASNLSLDFQGIPVQDVNPDPIPDLFGTEGAVVFGRYDGKQAITSKVRIRARVDGRQRSVSRTFTFPEIEEGHPYIPEAWAMRRIARLLERDWLKGPEPEVRLRIRRLTEQFGFKSPFGEGTAGSTAPDPVPSRKDTPALLWLFKTSTVASDVEADHHRIVEGKVFRRERNEWVDNRYRALMSTRTVRFLSDEYFDLVKQDTEIGRFLALAPNVTIVRDNAAVRVYSDSEESP